MRYAKETGSDAAECLQQEWHTACNAMAGTGKAHATRMRPTHWHMLKVNQVAVWRFCGRPPSQLGCIGWPGITPSLQSLQSWQWASAMVASRTMHFPSGGSAGALRQSHGPASLKCCQYSSGRAVRTHFYMLLWHAKCRRIGPLCGPVQPRAWSSTVYTLYQ